MAELTINGDVFKVEVEGQATKPALVLSNALGTVLTMWEPQMAALRRHFRVVRYDPRGHGGSSAAKGPCSIGRLGRDVLAIMDALDIERTHFVGTSMGGAVGQWLLANAPLRIERAVLANTCPRLGSPASWNARIATVLSGDMASNAEDAIERWFSREFRQANPEAIATIEENLLNASPGGYAACCAALRDMDLRQAIHGVAHPVLVITGTDDPVTAEADITAMMSALRDARHVALRAKHLANIEAADAFSDAVVSFLTSRVPARSAREAASPPRATTRTVSSARRVGARASARQPAPKAKSLAEAALPNRAKRSAAKSATKPPAAAKTGEQRRARSAPAPTRTGARGPLSAAAAAPRKRAAKGKVDPRPSAGRRGSAATKAKSGSASRAEGPRRPAAGAAKQVSSKAKQRSAAKGASPRRSAPTTAARGGNTTAPERAARKKAVVVSSATRKPARKSTAKPPAPRRKPSAGPRRPKGRGRS